jgi:hypothetical protein
MTSRVILLHAALVLAVPAAIDAQTSYGRESAYERDYGAPVDISISDLELTPEPYLNRAVRTRGTLDLEAGGRNQFMLRDSLGATVKIVPVDEIRDYFYAQQTKLIGRTIEITGVVLPLVGDAAAGRAAGMARVRIQFWSFAGGAEEGSKDALKKASVTSLASLVTAPGKRDGLLVRVVGLFRGSNLYGDLPATSRRARSDWVIKDEGFAVWVMGKRPKGPGFELDASARPATDRWIEVVGRPITRAGVTWIHALQVTLSGPPSRTAQAAPPAPSPDRPRVPPVIVFAMPVDGDGEVGADSRFTVQFSKDMEESSFKDRVMLRYAGPARSGNQPITNMTFSYDAGRRTLVVEPGTMLAPGRQVELLLLPGIVDTEGVALAPRAPAAAGDGVIDVLRYSTGP